MSTPEHPLDAQVTRALQELLAGRVPRAQDTATLTGDVKACLDALTDALHTDGVQAVRSAFTALARDRRPWLYRLASQQPPAPRAGTEALPQDEMGVPTLPVSARLAADLSLGACHWLEVYKQYSRAASPEGYEDFHLACGLWVLSTVAARRVCLRLQRKAIYPSLMLVLTARTTLFAKTTTAEVAKELIHAAGLGWLLGGDKITPQKLMSDMTGQVLPPDYQDLPTERQAWLKRRLAMPGQRGWYYDEFGKFVKAMVRQNSSMADFAELLLTFDRSPQTYENATLLRGCEPISKPYLSLLGSMTPANIRDNAKAGAEFWGDGFWARFAFVAAPPDEFKNATFSTEELAIPAELTTALRAWHERLGVPEISIEAVTDEHERETGRYTITRGPLPEQAATITQDAYQAYDTYRRALRSLIPTFHTQDLDGSYGRLPDIGLRIAILLASLENGDHIELRHWARAQELAELLRRNLHALYAQINSAEHEGTCLEEALLEHLRGLPASQKVTVRELQQYGPYRARKAQASAVKEALQNLAASGLVAIRKEGAKVIYTLSSQARLEREGETQ